MRNHARGSFLFSGPLDDWMGGFRPPSLVNINWSWMRHLLIRRQIKADKSYFAWPLLGRFEDSSGYFHGADALKELLLSLPSLKYMHITPSLQLFILSLSTQLVSVKYIWVLERHSPGRGCCVRKPSWSKVEWCHSGADRGGGHSYCQHTWDIFFRLLQLAGQTPWGCITALHRLKNSLQLKSAGRRLCASCDGRQARRPARWFNILRPRPHHKRRHSRVFFLCVFM